MTKHTPVLLQEIIDNLNLEKGDILLDGTLGGGGHSTALAEKLDGKLTIVGLDRERAAIKRSRERLETTGAVLQLTQESFRNLDRALERFGISSVDAVLLDLGISSDQLDESGRGFSFQRDEPLLMTMSDHVEDSSESHVAGELTAERIVNEFSEEALELIIRGFGEEKYSARIAKEIVERRAKGPIKTTFELRDAVIAAVPASYKRSRINPATRTFQAIRIAVNEELTALEEGLEKGFQALSTGGRFAVISFHSLEDRVVKNYFRGLAEDELAELIVKKPIVPSDEERQLNPRSRSAKLRVISKIK